MRTWTIAWVLLASLWAGRLIAQELADELPEPSEVPLAAQAEVEQPDIDELLGLDDSSFDGFVDETPLDSAQREKLLTLAERMRRIGSPTLNRFGRSIRGSGFFSDDRTGLRGELFRIAALVTYAAREELPPELQERFQIEAWYRCEAVTYLGARLEIYTLSVPEEWPLETTIRENTYSLVMFAKVLPMPEGWRSRWSPILLVAPRLSWFPRNLLGQLGMDHALFDGVRDRAGLDERECFYQMLAAVSGAEDDSLERAAQNQINERLDLLQRVARNPHQRSQDRAAATRSLERAEDHCDDVVPLFNDPAAQRGKLFVVSGDALRAIKIQVDDADIVERLGIDHYYEVEVVTVDSQNNPLVFCVAELPPEMPLGESIHQGVRVAGFFLKSWAYDSRRSAQADGERRQQLAPLLIAKSLRLLEPEVPQRLSGWLLAGGVALLAVLSAVVVWYVRRGDRRALAMASGTAASLPTEIALDPSAGATTDDE